MEEKSCYGCKFYVPRGITEPYCKKRGRFDEEFDSDNDRCNFYEERDSMFIEL